MKRKEDRERDRKKTKEEREKQREIKEGRGCDRKKEEET
jgi:hypothetical protein